MLGVAAQRIARLIRKPCNNADEAIAPTPEGTGLSGRSALSRRSPVGPATGVASLRASHPGKPPSRPRGAHSEVPLAQPRTRGVLGVPGPPHLGPRAGTVPSAALYRARAGA